MCIYRNNMEQREQLLNTIMGCSVCGYYTCNKRDFIRHNETKKHKLKIEKEETEAFIQEEKRAHAETEIGENNVISFSVAENVSLKPKRRVKSSDNKKNAKESDTERPIPSGSFTEEISDITDSSYDIDYSSDEEIYDTIYSNPKLILYQWPLMAHAFFAFCSMVMNIFFKPVEFVNKHNDE